MALAPNLISVSRVGASVEILIRWASPEQSRCSFVGRNEEKEDRVGKAFAEGPLFGIHCSHIHRDEGVNILQPP